jgi:hypothetical protein
MPSWDTITDSLIYDENIMMTIAWADVGGDPNEPLFTNGQRQHILTYRIGIEQDAQPQIARIDTVFSPVYGPAMLGRCDEEQSPPTAFVPGYIYYCQPNGIIEFEEESDVNIAPFDFDCPNPASTNFSIRLNSRHENQIVISIYDILGKKIVTKPVRFYPSGFYEVIFNDEDFRRCHSGVYFVWASNGLYSAVKKVTLIK